MDRKNLALFPVLVLLGASLVLAQSSHWLHVAVDTGAAGEQVKVNVPLKLVETVLPMIEEQELIKGKVKFDELPLTVPQMREIWQTLKAEGDFEIASVQEADMDLRIFMEGDYLYIRSAEDAEQNVQVTLPSQVVDALLGGERDELDLMAAAKALASTDTEELVRIRDGEETVRVWVDASSSSK
jgi:hypothetical protein